MYPEHNQLDPNNPDCSEDSHTQQTQTQNMDGRNSSPNVYIFLITVTMLCLYALLDTITSLGLKALGKEVERNHQRQSVGKS